MPGTVTTILKIFSSLVFTFKGALFQYLESKYGIVSLFNFILTHEKLNTGFEIGKVTHGMAFSAFCSFLCKKKTMILLRHQKLCHSVENLIHRITVIVGERNFGKKSSTTHFATFTVV